MCFSATMVKCQRFSTCSCSFLLLIFIKIACTKMYTNAALLRLKVCIVQFFVWIALQFKFNGLLRCCHSYVNVYLYIRSTFIVFVGFFFIKTYQLGILSFPLGILPSGWLPIFFHNIPCICYICIVCGCVLWNFAAAWEILKALN